MRFSCPDCNTTYEPPEERAGQTFLCGICKRQLRVPLSSTVLHFLPTPDLIPARIPPPPPIPLRRPEPVTLRRVLALLGWPANRRRVFGWASALGFVFLVLSMCLVVSFWRKTYTREEFHSLVMGASSAEVRSRIGSPDEINGSEWVYHRRTRNSKTGLVDESVSLYIGRRRSAFIGSAEDYQTALQQAALDGDSGGQVFSIHFSEKKR